MKLGIDSYCFHRFFGEIYDGQPTPNGPMSMNDFLAFAKELNVDGVSLESCFLPSWEEAWFKDLKASLDDYGFERVYAWGHPQGLEDGTNREAFTDMIAQIKFAALIGASVMRITPGPGSADFRYAPRGPRLDILVGWLKEAVSAAEHLNVKLALENHGDYTADEMLWLIEAVASPYLGVTFDTGNFLRLLDDPVRAAEKLAKYTLATHIKDLKVRQGVSPAEWFFFSSTPLGDGLVDIAAIARILKTAGYDGTLAVEIDHLHPDYHFDEHGAIRKSVIELRRLVDGLDKLETS
jgi:sugar phosphate isomerase/epimerase